MKYELTPLALKNLKKLSKPNISRIITKIEYLCTQSDPLTYADHLTDSSLGTYRFRVGDYRIICDRENDILVILKVGHRREIYRRR